MVRDGIGGAGRGHWPWGKGRRGEVKNQALEVEVSRAGVGRIGRRE